MKFLLTRRPGPPAKQFLVETLLVMKLTACLLLLTLFQASAKTTNGQTVNLNVKQAPIRKVLQEITAETGYHFLYSPDQLANLPPVTIQLSNATLETVMGLLLHNEPLGYSINADIKQIVIRSEPFSIDKSGSEKGDRDVDGTVVNEKGEPLQGASISIKGTKTATETNNKGAFNLHNVPDGAILVVTFVGYSPREIKADNAHGLEVSLTPKAGQLDETMIIAYGTTTERFTVGSISKVSSQEISEQPVLNPLAALEGRVPGLLVNSTSGFPGSSYTVQIRGQNTINTARTVPAPLNNPLFIVDGVPLATQNMNINQYPSLAAPGSNATYNNGYGGISAFNLINPSDIESIEILRDADATAIYGARGANGVILITTKKGKPGKISVTGSVWSGASQVTRSVNMMNNAQYLAARHEAFANDGSTPTTSNAPDLLVYDTTRYTDWKKYFLGGTAHTTDANLSLSGGTGNTTFLIGTGYHHEGYLFPGDYAYDRATVNTNFHHMSTDRRLSTGFSAMYTYDQNNSGGNIGALTSFTLAPDYPSLFNPDGSVNWNYKGFQLPTNPIGYLKQKYLIQNNSLLSHFDISYEILPGLSIKSNFGFNYLNTAETSIVPIGAQNPAINPSGSANFGASISQTWIIEPQAEYKRQIANGRLDVLLGGTDQQSVAKSTSISANNYKNDALLSSISAAGSTTASDVYSLYKYNAFFGRINYIWDNKYIVDLTGRRDGSSRFGPGRQFGNFGSVGSGWIFSEERLLKNAIPAISYGKVRVTYGTTGSDNIGDYQYIANYQSVTPSYQGSSGYVPTNLYNPDFSWAVNKKLEAGLELGFWADRLLVSADWYRDRCGNQLESYPLPSQSGFIGVTKNFPGLVQNTGWEIQISSTNIKSANFRWMTALNLTIPKNKLLDFPGLATSSYATTYVVGKSVNVVQAYKYIGVNDTTGVFQFQSSKGTPTYSPNLLTDRKVIGDLDPKFFGGLRNTFTYQGFGLDIFMDFRKEMATNYLYSIYSSNLPGFVNTNLPAFLANDHWSKPGDQSSIEKFTTGAVFSTYNAGRSFTSSNGAYSDASFIRFRTIALSYTLSKKLLSRQRIDNCRFYVNAQNLFTITDYKVGDPETHSLYSLPPLKTIVAGIQFTF